MPLLLIAADTYPPYRVRTDFWIQNSKLFFRLFSETIIFFFQTRGYQMGDLTKTKNKFTYRALVVALKKTQDHFASLYLYFPDFFQVWKIAGQISRLFQGFKTLYEPCPYSYFDKFMKSMLPTFSVELTGQISWRTFPLWLTMAPAGFFITSNVITPSSSALISNRTVSSRVAFNALGRFTNLGGKFSAQKITKPKH